jgi:shikimate kinase
MDISIIKIQDHKSPVTIVFLWGMMGVGKSKTGKRLAQKLGWKFVDTDALIEKQTERNVAQIFSENGEAYFRQLEEEVLLDAVRLQHVVVATGGGMPCDRNLASIMLNAGLCIWLEAEPKFLASRLSKGIETRPLLSGCKTETSLIVRLSELIEFRNPFYSEANWRVQAMDLNVSNLAQAVKQLSVR